ncbi:MAG TPA: hypothetical protein VGE32_15450 [Cellvibrio sp.]
MKLSNPIPVIRKVIFATPKISLVTGLFVLASCQSTPFAAADLTAAQWQQQLQISSVAEAADVQLQWGSKVTTEWLDWFDAERQRAVPALLFVPQQPTAEKIPLIVFSHGLGGARDRYAYLGQYWASKGVASLHLQHVGSDRQVWQGSRLTLAFRLKKAAGDEEALNRVADVKFALDQFLKTPFADVIDNENLMIAGHSYGANTAMLLAGAQVERDKRKIHLQDQRFSAAILISAPPFYSDESLADILANLTIPTLHITTTKDEIKVPGFYSAPEDRVALFKATGSTYKVLAVFYGGSHNIFTGRRQRPELAVQDQVIKAATQTLSLAFIKQSFSGNEQAIRNWQLQHQTLLADYQMVSSDPHYQ